MPWCLVLNLALCRCKGEEGSGKISERCVRGQVLAVQLCGCSGRQGVVQM